MTDEVRLLDYVHRYKDERGELIESWRAGKGIPRAKCGLTSYNIPGALRGFHYQRTNPRALVVRAVQGIIWDVAVDLRAGSDRFGKFYANRLASEQGNAVYIPAGFGHAFYAMTEAIVIYECSELFDPGSHTGVNWASPELLSAWVGIVKEYPVVSEQDRALPGLADIAPIEL